MHIISTTKVVFNHLIPTSSSQMSKSSWKMKSPLFRLSTRLYGRMKRSLTLLKYDNSTISEYFRQQGAQVGKDCRIAPRKLGNEPYLVKLGNHVAIAEGVKFHTHDGGTWIFREEFPDLRVFGPIIIEDNCLIGENAHILPNVTIGKNSLVAAGSVVIKDVPPNSIVIGVPARPMGSTDKYHEKCTQLWQKQRPSNFHPDANKSYEESPYNDLIHSQLKKHLSELFSEKLNRP